MTEAHHHLYLMLTIDIMSCLLITFYILAGFIFIITSVMLLLISYNLKLLLKICFLAKLNQYNLMEEPNSNLLLIQILLFSFIFCVYIRMNKMTLLKESIAMW
jgi:hypothetical protein